MAGAGNLDRRIVIRHRPVTGRNAINEPVFGSAVDTPLWAGRRDASDGERLAAAQVGAHIETRFLVRSSTFSKSIQPKWELLHDGRSYNITGIKETAHGRHRFLEISAVTSGDQ
ncbi:MAG: phage head closure protein [Thermaurantiacus sp.]